MNSKITVFALAVLLISAIVCFASGSPVATIAADEVAGIQMLTPLAPQPGQATPQPASGIPIQPGYISEETVAQMLRDQQAHDETMADKITTVAVSADIAQTLVAMSPVALLAVVVIGLFWLISRARSRYDDEE